MKKRFLILLTILVICMSLVAICLSLFAVRGGVERLLVERANFRLSLIVLGFNATARDIDIYSYVDFDTELVSIRKGIIPIFQYGTARLDLKAPSVKKLERSVGSYDFTLYVDFRSEVAAYLRPFRMMIAITAAIYAVLFAISGWFFIGMVVDPIADLAARMATITSRNLRTRLPEGSRKDEIRQLIVTFNTMLDEIVATYDRQARFVEDMTHDIVTPVQILEGYRQLIERHGTTPSLVNEYLDVSKVQLGRLLHMTSSLKAALAAERRRHVQFSDATEITARNVVYYRELFPELTFDAEIAEHVVLPIDPCDLERVENILIDNAVKYGRGGGRIAIHLSDGKLTVRDFGAGMTKADRPFERYRRGTDGEQQSGGAGIGLSIVKGFSKEYGFKVELETRPGEGCAFHLLFPTQSS
jgi:signal transduction histidine kinase